MYPMTHNYNHIHKFFMKGLTKFFLWSSKCVLGNCDHPLAKPTQCITKNPFQRLTRNLVQKLHGYLCQNSISNIENKRVTVQRNLKKEHNKTGGLRWQLEATPSLVVC